MKSQIRAVLLVFVFVVSGAGLAGCMRPVKDAAVKGDLSESAPATTEEPVESERPNLSMAKALKALPPSPYLLGPEDVVEIIVFRHPDLRMQTRVGSEGKISYYLIGDVDAEGLSLSELKVRIEKALSKYIRTPQVVVRLVEARSHKIYALGEVENPGVYRMRSNYTLVEAISAAGGITSDAYLSGAYVVRDGQILLVNFYELIEKGNTEENIPMMADDVIYIPDNRDQQVFVLGEVNKQAAIPMREEMTLFEAIAEAGGFTRDARKDSIVVMRGNFSEPEVMLVNADAIRFGENMLLQEGDIVYVASSTFANVERIAKRITTILSPFLSVARGIIFTDAAQDVLDGKQTELVVGD